MTDPLPPTDAVPTPGLLTRVCRHCSAQSQVQGDFCPNCGKPFAGRTGPSKKTLVIAAVVALILVAGGASAFLVKRHNDDVAADKRAAVAARAERKAADKAAAEKSAQEAKQAAQKAADAAERQSRREQVKYLQRTITKDAGKDVAKGLLDGPILRTVCTATGGGSTDDLTALTGTFDCLAVTTKNSDGTESGYGYAGTIDWGSGRISWQLGG
jgi:membrane protein involved in colicin uptake